MKSAEAAEEPAPDAFADQVRQISLLRAISQHRPVGLHRHFNMISVVREMGFACAREKVGATFDGSHEVPKDSLDWSDPACSSSSVWAKLRTLYDLERLNELDESDEEEGPAWLEHAGERAKRAANDAGLRTRVVAGADEEEFSLHPWDEFEDLIAPRRVDDGSAATSGSEKQRTTIPRGEAAQDMVPGSSDADQSDVGTDEERTPRSRSASTRRSRKRALNEDQATDDTADSPDAGAASGLRTAKRRRSVAGRAKDDGASASESGSTRTSTRRHPRHTEDDTAVDESSDAAADTAVGDDDAASETEQPTAAGTRGARATPSRRASNATATPEAPRISSRSAARSGKETPRPSPSNVGARPSRPRRDASRA